jgi:hypothetical protein
VNLIFTIRQALGHAECRRLGQGHGMDRNVRHRNIRRLWNTAASLGEGGVFVF